MHVLLFVAVCEIHLIPLTISTLHLMRLAMDAMMPGRCAQFVFPSWFFLLTLELILGTGLLDMSRGW